MKITAKTTKEEMTKYLGEHSAEVKTRDKSLFERLAYASKMFKKDPEKVTRKDLVDLVKDTMACIAPMSPTPALAENQLKKSTSLKKGKKSEETASETTETTEEAPKKEEEAKKVDSKKSANKTKAESKKTEPKKSGDASLSKKTENTKAIQLAETFKDSLEIDGEEYEIAHDITTMEELFSALESDEVILFAMYWTKRHLKQFQYFYGAVTAPKEFPMDLDLATCIYASDNGKVAYAVSSYTEACYMILPENLEEFDGMRYSGGVEYQIYRKK